MNIDTKEVSKGKQENKHDYGKNKSVETKGLGQDCTVETLLTEKGNTGGNAKKETSPKVSAPHT